MSIFDDEFKREVAFLLALSFWVINGFKLTPKSCRASGGFWSLNVFFHCGLNIKHITAHSNNGYESVLSERVAQLDRASFPGLCRPKRSRFEADSVHNFFINILHVTLDQFAPYYVYYSSP